MLGQRSKAVPPGRESKSFRCHDNLCGNAGGTGFDGMRKMARYFFPDLQQVHKDQKKKKRGDMAR